jgi:multidrug resistance efflux pump
MASPPATAHNEDDMKTIEGQAKDQEHSSERREGMPRRHPISFALALVLLFVALPIGYLFGYLYGDYTSQFESADYSYIASPPLGGVPEVSGHIKAIAASDNQRL